MGKREAPWRARLKHKVVPDVDMAKPQEAQAEAVEATALPFAASGLEDLFALSGRLQDLKDLLSDTECVGGRTLARIAQRLGRQISSFRSTITVIGPSRAGKTELVNALAARPGYLPTDTPPWAATLATLHLNSPEAGTRPAARFRLFDHAEMERQKKGIARDLVRFADDPGARAVYDMLQSVRTITGRRLGEGFDHALGTYHEFSDCDDGALRRFLATNAGFETACVSGDLDYFADLTAEADLDLDAPHLPLPLCIRDVPGALESLPGGHEATFGSLRDRDTCILVLSALQDPASFDKSVLDRLAGADASQLVLFVNRIDALLEPETSLPQYRDALLAVLEKNGLAQDVAIVFGSARWATAALKGDADVLADAGRRALMSLGQISEAITDRSSDEALWDLSGLPALWRAVSSRIAHGSGERLVKSLRARALSGIMAAEASCEARKDGTPPAWGMTGAELDARFGKIEKAVVDHLEAGIGKLVQRYQLRIDQAQKRFIGRAGMSLTDHLETQAANNAPWGTGTGGLRALLGTAHDGMIENLSAMWHAHAVAAEERISSAYHTLLGGLELRYSIVDPLLPPMPMPMALGYPCELDVKSTCWNTMATGDSDPKRRATLISAAIAPLVSDMRTRLPAEISARAVAAMRLHLAEQREILDSLIESRSLDEDDLESAWSAPCTAEQIDMIALVKDELSEPS